MGEGERRKEEGGGTEVHVGGREGATMALTYNQREGKVRARAHCFSRNVAEV